MITRCKKNIKDIKTILKNLRNEDKEEMFATYGRKWKYKALKIILDKNTYTVIGKNKSGIPLVMGGCRPYKNNLACVWFLTAKNTEKENISILFELKKEFEYYDNFFWATYNIIYKSNKGAKRWLKWLDFKFPEGKKYSAFEKQILKYFRPKKDFEIFYRLRPIKGLGAKCV